MPTSYTWLVDFPTTAEPDPTTELPTSSPPTVSAGDGCCEVNQSAIQEMRSQLFLDKADGIRLDYVGQNLGLARPLAGFSDVYWRYAIKEIALKYKLVPNSFRRVLEVTLGPQKAIAGELQEPASAGDMILTLADASKFLQVGEVTLDEGLATEESVTFCYRDSIANELCLTTPLRFDHSVREYAISYLVADTAAGATSLLLSDTSQFPTTGFPYPIIIDRGTGVEETLRVTANNGLGLLTLSSATTANHFGAKSKFLRRELAQASPAKSTFLVLADRATRTFPAIGYVRVASGEINEVVVEYTANDIATNTLTLRTPLAAAHTTGETVELVSVGSLVETASVLQYGIGWQIFESAPRRVKIFIPGQSEFYRIVDASWFHGPVLPAFATQLNGAVTAGDDEITVDSTSGLPASGLIQIGSSILAYVKQSSTLLALLQSAPLGYADNAVVTYYRQSYTGTTSLEEGNVRNVSGDAVSNKFPGPYLFDETQQGPTATSTTLATGLPAETRVVVDQVIGATNLEVFDASTWPAPPFDPITVVVGKDSGFAEVRTLIDRTLKKDCVGAVASLASIGATTISYTSSGASQFPESDGSNPAGYRIIVNRGAINEEILLVHTNAPGGPGTFTLVNPTTLSHSASATIHLLFDVITTDSLTQPHTGDQLSPTVLGHTVFIYTTEIAVTSAANFPTSGAVILNFGKERLDCRRRIIAMGSATSYTLASTVDFPTAGYPYPVILGEGTAKEETVTVTNNNTITGVLTFTAPGALNTHRVKDYVAHYCGVPEAVEYTSKDGNLLVLNAPTSLESLHRVGERVILSAGDSEPRTDGWSYALKMPQPTGGRVARLLDFVRAAGVQVEFLTDR